MKKPVLVITCGDVNGIGPEILVKALAHPEIYSFCMPIVLGDKTALEEIMLPGVDTLPFVEVTTVEEATALRNGIPVCNAGFPAPSRQPGVMDPEAGRCATEWIKEAVRWCIAGKVAGMVTCPISKECMQRAGYPYTGHTSLIADMTQSPDYRMCLFTETMRIVHITAHASLENAVKAVRKPRIVKSIQIAHDALQRMGFTAPRIAVAGLNPHAGEAGVFGREELEEIMPAIEECVSAGIHCTGPYPPDTVFRRMYDGEFDLVVAMYHDQGHIPLKLIAMDEGVNVTLGIPIVRTSVDHGTAYDIAGQGVAREASLCAALHLAAQLNAFETAKAKPSA